MIFTCSITLKNGMNIRPKVEAPDSSSAKLLFEGMYPERTQMGYPFCDADDNRNNT